MAANEQTCQQIERFIRKIVQKLSTCEESSRMTDIHLKVSQESGEILAYDDENLEITRCVVEEWIDDKDDDFYDKVTVTLRNELLRLSELVDNIGILKPYSFVLEDDDNENIAELYVADDDTIILDSNLMKGLDKDLTTFFNNLIKGV